MDETKLIKKLVRKFNRGRANIWKYKDLILSFNKRKPNYINYKQTPFRKPVELSNTIVNLTRKINPYNKEEFQIISNRTFLSIHIREVLNEWEHNQDSPIVLTEAANEVIDNLKFDYPKLQKWSNSEIIKLNWVNRDEIQKDLNKKVHAPV